MAAKTKKILYRLIVLAPFFPFISWWVLGLPGRKYGFFYPLITTLFMAVFCFYIYQCMRDYDRIAKKQRETITHMTYINHELKKNNLIKEAMLEISNSVLNIKNMDELLNSVIATAVQLIDNADSGSILIKNEEGRLEFKAAFGYDLEKLSGITLAIEETFLYQYTEGNCFNPCIIHNPLNFNERYMARETYDQLMDADALILKSTISAPIVVDNELYGMINVDNTRTDQVFTEEDKMIISYFANQLGIAIKNARLFEKTLFLSRYDGLTKVYNRHYFDELFDSIYKRAKRYGESFCLCVIDLNDLKIINDLHGHSAGDFVIKTFSTVLSENTRDSDLIGRYGGDEFVMVFLNTMLENCHEKLEMIAQRLKDTPIQLNHTSFQISFSYGIACFPKDAADSKELFKIADLRMYKHKLHQKTI
ncbi:sensor domain-containing diguanylate cyclase [Thermotalea metallivorans]|uniref:Phytochrome-like protein cph2 n=1 Tax=Thermotalea metallivorans TaxID=520762 RepID=A0A140L3Y9_9FIRM|nr:sensor domain-containing diguanylate cyclase [Thermotalea metallivorans]KXG75264.1 Phytochrome-like protein cph2 [Thermotalea metallivorans]